MAKGVRFHYLYRDSGNYKTFGHKDFSNPSELNLEQLICEIRKSLIDTEFFYPDKVGIKKFLFHRYLDDFSWYEFEGLEAITTLHLTNTIDDFISRLRDCILPLG